MHGNLQNEVIRVNYDSKKVKEREHVIVKKIKIKKIYPVGPANLSPTGRPYGPEHLKMLG